MIYPQTAKNKLILVFYYFDANIAFISFANLNTRLSFRKIGGEDCL